MLLHLTLVLQLLHQVDLIEVPDVVAAEELTILHWRAHVRPACCVTYVWHSSGGDQCVLLGLGHGPVWSHEKGATRCSSSSSSLCCLTAQLCVYIFWQTSYLLSIHPAPLCATWWAGYTEPLPPILREKRYFGRKKSLWVAWKKLALHTSGAVPVP